MCEAVIMVCVECDKQHSIEPALLDDPDELVVCLLCCSELFRVSE